MTIQLPYWLAILFVVNVVSILIFIAINTFQLQRILKQNEMFKKSDVKDEVCEKGTTGSIHSHIRDLQRYADE